MRLDPVDPQRHVWATRKDLQRFFPKEITERLPKEERRYGYGSFWDCPVTVSRLRDPSLLILLSTKRYDFACDNLVWLDWWHQLSDRLVKRVKAMRIGQPKREFTVEPVQEPIPKPQKADPTPDKPEVVMPKPE